MPSTTAWIFVFLPPLVIPIHWFCSYFSRFSSGFWRFWEPSSILFFCTCTCFMSFDTGAVDADILHVRIQRQIPDDFLKDSASFHFMKRLYTVCQDHIGQCCTASHDPADSVEHLSGVFWWSSPGVFFCFCDIRFYLSPFFFGYLVSSNRCYHRSHLWYHIRPWCILLLLVCVLFS